MKNNKNLAIVSFGAILMLLGACQQGPKKEEPKESEPRQEKVAPPKGIISLEESKSLYDNYTKHRIGLIEEYEAERSQEEKFIPARLTSFSFTDIQKYMAYVEQEAEKAGVEVASLRLYFANYPDKPDFPDGTKVVHPRQNSIFIVPTTMMDGKEYGFYIGADGKAKKIADAVGGSNAEEGTSEASLVPNLFQGDGESLNLNHGSSEPPPYTDF